MENARQRLLEMVAQNRLGDAKGIYSVCSASSEVIEACCQQAKKDGSVLLVEATTNQVDQYGGYTGMKPADFVNFVHTIADKVGIPKEMIMLGGDHLGPYKWRGLPSREAMLHADVLVAEYVKAGFQKIHLDTSMFCADDQGDRKKPLRDEVVAERAVRLCRISENTWKNATGNQAQPLYIIGSEVPVPGGAQEAEDIIQPTTPQDLQRTIDITKESFYNAGLQEAWERVIGVVVQPGVEFGDDMVFHYNRERAKGLSNAITAYDTLVYEAHSTDYQSEASLKALVEDHFCILKVGPWLTFAYREALYALEAIEVELLDKKNNSLSNLKSVLDRSMEDDPGFWKPYYAGTEASQLLKRKYSFSDRSRYYWPKPEVISARDRLFENLERNQIPLSLLSQFMPKQFYKVLGGQLENQPRKLVLDHIQTIASIYSRACGL